MRKNLFFTGEKGVGKSTLLGRLVSGLELGGFRTLPFVSETIGKGFYIAGTGEPLTGKPAREQIIALRSEKGIVRRFTEVFETFGVMLLTRSLQENPHLIIADELGFLESEAYAFQRAILECLDGPIPVWGVIKAVNVPFLRTIREREDVAVVTVTRENRDELYGRLSGRGIS